MNSTKKRIISLMTAGMLTGVLGMYDGINTIFDYQETKEVSSLKEKGISAVKTLETLERERNWITPLPKIDYSSEKLKPYLDSLTNFYAHNDEKIKTLDDAITIVKSDLETITNNPVYLRDRSEVKQMERKNGKRK